MLTGEYDKEIPVNNYANLISDILEYKQNIAIISFGHDAEESSGVANWEVEQEPEQEPGNIYHVDNRDDDLDEYEEEDHSPEADIRWV